MEDLDEWSRKYPQSALADERIYGYMQVHSMAAHPDKVLEYGATLMARNLAGVLNDQQTLGVLYLVTVNAAAIPHPSTPQRTLGKAAAQTMLEALPAYFEDRRRPSATSETDWQQSRRRLEIRSARCVKIAGNAAGAVACAPAFADGRILSTASEIFLKKPHR